MEIETTMPFQRLARHLRSAIALTCGLGGAVGFAQSPLGMLVSEQSRTDFTVQGAGARAMGLGGAFIAVADDATAVSFNPAGLAQLMQPEVSFVGRDINRRVSFQDFQTYTRLGTSGVSDSLIGTSRFDPLFFSGTLPLQVADRTLCLQLSAQRAFAMGERNSRRLMETSLDGTQSSQLDQTIDQSGQIDVYSLAMAYEVSQRILLGASFNLWRGHWDLNVDNAKAFASGQDYVNLDQGNRFSGQNYNLGLIWRWPIWSLGLVYHTAFHADYSYQMSLSTNLPIHRSPSSADTALHWPSVMGLGLAVRPSEGLLFTADLEQTQWSTAKFMSSDPRMNGLDFFSMDKGRNTPNAMSARMGAEYLLVRDSGVIIPVRLGACREPQPVVDRLTGEQRIMYGLSAGTGFKKGAYSVDLAYRYAWSSRRASQFLDVEQLLAHSDTSSLGQERTTENRVDLSFIVQFKKEPVQKALRYLFVGDR